MNNAASLSPAVAQPPHVPDALVYDFDLFKDAGLLADPHERVLDMVKTAPPIFWTPRNGGHWMLLSHQANFEASRDIETFSSEVIPQTQIKAMMAQMPPGSPHIPQPIPINVDPPEHTKYRAPLNRAFAPRAIADLKDSIRSLAHELIDRVVDNGQCEFMSAIAEPMPVQVFLKILGLPLAEQDAYRELVKDHLADTTDQSNVVRKLLKITGSMRPTLLARRDQPRDDLISLLWQTEVDGKPTTLEDMENYCVLLFIAGLDTVMNGMGHGVRHLAMHPELQAELRADPELVADATEELLRRYTFTVPPRRVNKDVVFQGVDMKLNDKAVLYLPAADLDSAEYPEAERFNMRREAKAHIAFNAGPHRCLGSHLARVELQIICEV